MMTILTSVKQHLIIVLICISLISSNFEHFFHVSTGLLYVFEDTSVEVSCPFFYWVVQESPLEPCVEQRHVPWAAAATLQPWECVKDGHEFPLW